MPSSPASPKFAPGLLKREWRAMGTDIEVILNGGNESLLDLAAARIEDLESRWSRFRASSELESTKACSGMRLHNPRPHSPQCDAP